MRSKYVLITLYHHTYVGGREVWLLYGWLGGAANESIAEIPDKLAAFERAHSFGVPVVLGYGDWLYPLCDWLETHFKQQQE